MRLEVIIPDQIVAQAQEAADHTGVTLDRFVAEALAQSLVRDPSSPFITPNMLVILERAEADIDAGKGISPEQVRKNLSARRAEWIQKNAP